VSSISVRGLRKDFQDHSALKSVSLEVKDQEFCVLLGPSGCGKTTMLRILAGLETETAGELFIGDRRVNGLAPGKRKIAMVFQNYAVFPHLTIRDNIGFGLRMAKQPADKIERQVKRSAEMMHIEDLLDRYPAQLSGGQRQRVAVARALAVVPDVLLMDEPLSNLDALLRLEMRTELKALLKETRTTTIYVTHDQIEALSLADRIAVMHDGGIVQYSDPGDVYSNPATTFVGGFIGSPPMNFLPTDAVGGALDAALRQGIPPLATTLGIRPEYFELRDGASAWPVAVSVVEALGSHLQITGRVFGTNRIRLSLAAEARVQPGDTLRVSPKADKIRWYDAAGRLLPGDRVSGPERAVSRHDARGGN
jgi:multiple sugar transport system ATP-binding protein